VHPFSTQVAARRANARLVVAAATIEASFESYTGASHDSLFSSVDPDEQLMEPPNWRAYLRRG
jgi:hypothetical protein